MKTILLLVGLVLSLIGYSLVGTCGRVAEIKVRAPAAMVERNWKILRYEGFKYGSWSHHGGNVYYHVANIDNPTIQYRVHITLWNGELQYYYGAPESLQRLNLSSAALEL